MSGLNQTDGHQDRKPEEMVMGLRDNRHSSPGRTDRHYDGRSAGCR